MNSNRGQSLSEYVIVFALVIAVIMGLQLYVKQTLQGRYKAATDKMIANIRQAKSEVLDQYEPYYQSSDQIITADEHTKDILLLGEKTKDIRNELGYYREYEAIGWRKTEAAP